MKKILLLWSVYAFILNASAQHYYSYNNSVRLYLTDTIVVDSGNPDVENYLAFEKDDARIKLISNK